MASLFSFLVTIEQGICRKNSQQHVRVQVSPKFCLCMFSHCLVSGQLKKMRDLHELLTWAHDMVTRDIGQRTPYFDSCQLIITWTYGNGATLLFSRYETSRMDIRMDGRTYGQSRDNQKFWDRWVTQFSKVWGSARAPLACRSSAITILYHAIKIHWPTKSILGTTIIPL